MTHERNGLKKDLLIPLPGLLHRKKSARQTGTEVFLDCTKSPVTMWRGFYLLLFTLPYAHAAMRIREAEKSV